MAHPLRHYRPQALNVDTIALFENLTRRRFLIGASGLTLGALTGCGAPSASAPTATSSPSTAASRIMQGVLGNTYNVSGPPKRLHVGAGPDLDTALAVGIVPSSIEIYGDAQLRPDQAAAAGIDLIRYTEGPNLEALAAANPDLILTGWGNEEYQQRMAEIAPTFFIDSSKPWRDVTRQIGTILFKEAEVEAVIANLDRRFADFRERLVARAGETPFILYTSTGAEFTIMTKDSAIGQLMVELGFASLKKDGNIYGEKVSLEGLASEAQGDFLLLLVDSFRYVDPNQPVPEEVQQLLNDPITKALPAARGGTFLYPRDGNDVYYFTVMLIPIFVDLLEQLLTQS
ncbi:ABC transporter substrate-binding protein [Candidatus Gracilibacteria bacterium]|nr:ABC transporter substrate-binding protein [Candidatus Gracilibacteria bacterium]